MSWILRILASPALRSGIVVALRVLAIAEDALRGVLSNDQISDAARKNIEGAVSAVTAVREFLMKVGNLFGVSSHDVVAGVKGFDLSSTHYIDSLRDITKRL